MANVLALIEFEKNIFKMMKIIDLELKTQMLNQSVALNFLLKLNLLSFQKWNFNNLTFKKYTEIPFKHS